MHIVKKIFTFILFFLIIGCKSNQLSKSLSQKIVCPDVFFSSEHKKYVNGNLENSKYRAEINNADFIEGCESINSFFSSDLSLLFIIDPIEPKNRNINLPFYLAFIDDKNRLIDIQYFRADGEFETEPQSNIFLQTELNKTVKVSLNSQERNFTIILGFMLDNKKKLLLD
tara:strand:+ start:244 stop:753 length:510 start_codon:yes stop_codon:yes gene_type:complete